MSGIRIFLYEYYSIRTQSLCRMEPRTNRGKFRMRAKKSIRLTPERMAKARVPAPENKRGFFFAFKLEGVGRQCG
jgi:hypothetical protein